MRFITADRLFDGERFLPAGAVLVLDENGHIGDIIAAGLAGNNNVERFKGTICPGFVNAHCHLELSHLKGKIARHTGLPAFAREVILKRGGSTEKEAEECMQRADKEMFNNGIVAVGDISNTTASLNVKQQSNLFYHTFVELIGLNPQRSATIFSAGLELLNSFNNDGLSASLAPHAPYSTSRELIKLIADFDSMRHYALSIHNQESEEEAKFFAGQKSGFNDLYDFLKLDISWFKAPGTTSLKHYGALLPKGALLVHNTFTDANDIAFVSSQEMNWCFCPGANLYIEDCLPDFSLFAEHKNSICIGTDSLASNTQLDVVTEVNHVLSNTKLFSEEDLLRMMTLNGAKALGVSERFGRLVKGRNSGLNLVTMKNGKIHFIKKIC